MLLSTFVLKLFVFIQVTSSILDDDILYDLEWHSDPITPEQSENRFNIVSKRKETYSCTLPVSQKTFSKTDETVTIDKVLGLLKDLHSRKLCTYRFDPYWTYEFCHGKHVRQYHETKTTGKRTTIQEYFLGYYHAETQQSMMTIDENQVLKISYKSFNDRNVPMLPIRYTDGTNCDINENKPRETVIYYVCQDTVSESIVHFHEISSCYYEMIVATPWLCKLSAFSPAEKDRYSIECAAQTGSGEKPKNLRKLEKERLSSANSGGGAQFTMTNADGTTVMISYDYVKDQPVDDPRQTIKVEIRAEPKLETPIMSGADRQFLEEFFSGQRCLTGGTGWWRFEFCYGKHVIQFHDDADRRSSILLGRWNPEKHAEFVRQISKKNTQSDRYVSLFYTDGELCQITQRPRTVEVKLRCLNKAIVASLASMYLVEPETCSYVLGVESPLFCNLIEYLDDDGIPNFEQIKKEIFKE